MPTITFRFRHSRADDLPWFLELARRGAFKELQLSEKLRVYETTFDLLDPIALGHALSLATALVHDKKAEVFSGSSSLHMCTARDVLRCYQQSLLVGDPHAHCWFKISLRFDLTVTTFTLEPEAKAFIFPCRHAASHSYGIHYEHPGMIEDQLHSTLHRAGTRWCPRLADLSEWRAINVHFEREPQ